VCSIHTLVILFILTVITDNMLVTCSTYKGKIRYNVTSSQMLQSWF